MFAVISDIHANYEALTAVFHEVDRLGVEKVICLGDVVGYGPSPAECVDLVRRRCVVTLCGNHDFALVYGANGFNSRARDALDYQRRQMMPRPGQDDPERAERWEFLKNLPKRYVEDDMLFVHGAPRNPVNEYLRRSEVLLQVERKLRENFDQVDWLCFVGHTHRPGIITQQHKWLNPDDVGGRYAPQRHEKAIFNVGSVGQPRDRDMRASFVTVTPEGEVRFRRVGYNVDAVIEKITETSGLDPALAKRLLKGI